MRYGLLRVLISALIAFSCSSAASECVLPVPDGGDAEPSPPSLTGTILRVAPGQVVVGVAGTAKPQSVVVAPATELFTVYGGGFEFQDLRAGLHTLIWFKGCTPPKQGLPVAAVLEVCSLAPEPCPR